MPRAVLLSTLAVVSALAALLVSATAGATTARISVLAVEAGATTANIRWKVEQQSRITIEYGVADTMGIWAAPTVTQTAQAGVTQLVGLEPNTTYRYRFVGISSYGTIDQGGSFTTWPWPTSPFASLMTQQTAAPTPGIGARPVPGAPAPGAGGSKSERLFAVNGGPLFFRMVFRACPYAIERGIRAGINLFMGTNTQCGTPAAQLKMTAGQALTLLDETERGRVKGPGLVGWHMEDELDARLAKTPAKLPRHDDNGLLTFLTVTDHYSPRTAPPTAGKGVYKPLFNKADVIGFDSYPIEEWCNPDTIDRVWWLQHDLMAQVGGKPTFQWIEAGPMEKCKKYDPTPAVVRAETWLAIAAGARGIGYFPDVWPEAITKEITKINREIVALSPALLNIKEARTFSVGGLRVGIRKNGGATYVIAVNPTSKPLGKVTLPVAEAGGKKVSVFGEGRDVQTVGNQLQDDFGAYGTHIYVIPPA